MIPKELYLEILNSCGLSQTMKEHLEKQELPKRELIKLLVNAPVALTKKLDLLEQISETEDLYEEMLEQVNRLLPGEKGHLREWQSVWARSASRIKGEIQRAIDALQVDEGEFFWMEEHWFDYEWLDENQGGVCAFQSLDAALQAIRDMMQEEEWDEDATCWTELTKWTPGENGVMVNEYRYYLIRDEIVFFSKKTDGPRALGYLDPYRFVFPTEAVCCSTPFQPGDIVTLDPRPFAPPIHAVLLQTRRDCCGLRGLYCGFDGSWNDVAIYHRHGWDEITGYEPILSPVYRLSLCSFDDLLPDEREVLQSVHNYIGGNEAHGDEVDRLFFLNHSMESKEVLEMLHLKEKEKRKTGGGRMEDNKTMQDYLFDFAYGEALRDAINRQSFKGEKNYLYDCKDGKAVVRTYIDAILNGEHPSFNKAEEEAEEKFNEFIRNERPESNQRFTFGNTQKLINMTVKYIYISAYVQRCEEFRNLFADCHCPLDRRMAAVVGKEFDETDDEAAQVIEEESSDIYKKINKDITWSKVDKETYNCYQQMVRLLAEKENLIPIEYDFVKWGTSKS